MGLFRRIIEISLGAVECDDDCDAELALSFEERGQSIRDKAIAAGWTFDGAYATCPECSKKKGGER